MVGVNRILRGQTITSVVGNTELTVEQEADLRDRYVNRALQILTMEVTEPTIFTLEGTA